MRVLAHRGWWFTPEEKNSITAIKRAFDAGFGIETDIRDFDGTVVVSHDPPTGSPLALNSLLELALPYGNAIDLALNVKADGLQKLIEGKLRENRQYFLFDMSVPDLIASLRTNLRCFTRQSDVESTPVLLEQVSGVWLDSFAARPPDIQAIRCFLSAKKEVALVSPELHHFPHLEFWNILRSEAMHRSGELMLCTDFPDEARNYFAVT
jgi:glycerophosphoryl diester phosphodiesterase